MRADAAQLSPTMTARWRLPAVALLATGVALTLYWWTAAPGVTWAHEAADSGELLAAALTNGVPHPPGYPLYMILLGVWLKGARLLIPAMDPAYFGNALSAVCAALSVGVTVAAASVVLPGEPHRLLWALLAGLAWAITPLLWSQATVTEVYALHALLVALLAWAVLSRPQTPLYWAPILALGVAHHLTFVLLLPAVLYWLWIRAAAERRSLWPMLSSFAAALVVGVLFYVRTPLAAAGNGVPPPVNWGYADNWRGFWWLVSGAAYRSYLFAGTSSELFGRLTSWAYTITTQYTPVGLALALVGLSAWDRSWPALRNFSILWIVPVSIYMIVYFSRDSEIYLLPVVWWMALWIASSLPELITWAEQRWPAASFRSRFSGALGVGLALALSLLTFVRAPQLSLRHDSAARQFVSGAAAVLEPDSIVISLADPETFALWYGAWGSGELSAAAPNLVLINYSLYQFDWYRRLLRELYPAIINTQPTVEAVIADYRATHPIFLSEQLDFAAAGQLTPSGPLWRYRAQ